MNDLPAGEPPRVSIVICTRDRCASLARTISALRAMADRPAWEAIFVDNGSTDPTPEVLARAAREDTRIRVLRETEAGLGAARDTGWRHAAAPVVAFTDDDCYPARDYVEMLLLAFASRPDLGYLGGRIELFDPADAPVTIDLRERLEDIPPCAFVPAGALHGANLAFRREVLERIGGFDRGLGAGTGFPCEDIDAIARAAWAGVRGGYDPRPVVSHHHGRREADLPAIMSSYDRGRGAYYVRFLLRPDTRRAYLQAWLARCRPRRAPETWARTRRELASARAYLRQRSTSRAGLAAAAGALALVESVAFVLQHALRRL